MSGRLSGRAALVTGASAGIGRATAIALAREGAEVILTGRRQQQLDAAVEQCRALGARAEGIRGDLDDFDFIRSLCAAAGHADILVNNAGFLTYAPVLETPAADCAAMLRINVLAAFEVSREIGLRMVERRRGHMVFVTSLAARNVNPLGAFYGATKHALSAFAKGFRAELKGFGLKVTEVAPGMVDTEIRNASTHPAVVAAIAARKYLPLTADDVAEAVVFAVTASDGCCPDLIELRPKAG